MCFAIQGFLRRLLQWHIMPKHYCIIPQVRRFRIVLPRNLTFCGVAFNKFNAFVADCANKVHNLGSDTLKIMLTNSAPLATNAVKADLTDISAGNGYSAGGTAVTGVTSTQTSGTYKLVGSSVTFTASGAVGPFRYAVIYNSTAASGNLIGWWDYGSSISMANGDTFTVTLDGTNGILQLA